MSLVPALGVMVLGAVVAAAVLLARDYSVAGAVTIATLLFGFSVLTYYAAGRGIIVFSPSKSAGVTKQRVALAIACCSLTILVGGLIAFRP